MTRRPGSASDGFVTPAFVASVGLTLVLLVMAANLLAVHHVRGVLQSAVEEGARQAVAAGGAACLARVQSVVEGLGVMGEGVGAPDCQVGPEGAAVTVSASFAPWLPVLPTQTVHVRGQAATRPAVAP